MRPNDEVEAQAADVLFTRPSNFKEYQPGESGVGGGYLLFTYGEGFLLSGGCYGLGQPTGAGLAAFQYVFRSGDGILWKPRVS